MVVSFGPDGSASAENGLSARVNSPEQGALTWPVISFVVAVAAVCARSLVRKIKHVSVGMEDVLILLAQAMDIAVFVLTVLACDQIYGRLTSSNVGSVLSNTAMTEYIVDFLGLSAIAAAKISLVSTFRKSMQPTGVRTAALYAAEILVLVQVFVSVVVLLARCHTTASFDFSFPQDNADQCLSQLDLALAVFVPQLVTDLVFLALPFFCGNGSKMSGAQKFAAALLFLFALDLPIFSILRLCWQINYSQPLLEPSFAAVALNIGIEVPLLVWANGQVAVAILAMSLCSLLPVFGREERNRSPVREKGAWATDDDSTARVRKSLFMSGALQPPQYPYRDHADGRRSSTTSNTPMLAVHSDDDEKSDYEGSHGAADSHVPVGLSEKGAVD